jgi:RND family efflux transporter MFP subunit
MAAKHKRRWVVVLLAVPLLIAAGGVYLLHRHRVHREAEARNHQVDGYNRGPKVLVASVVATPPLRDVTLPSDVRAYNQSTLYAKTAGYLSLIRVDKGDVVREGELLAFVASPETDRDVVNARADLANKRRFYERQRNLVGRRLISQQDFENALYAMEESRAVLDRELALQKYERITAPFSGTITGRYVDPGALIPAGTGSTSGAQPVVDIADLTHLRIAVFVGQDVAPFVNEETLASIRQDERPDLDIEARVTLTSGALDPRSRTMLCEIWLDNKYGLQPGTFVHVTLHVHVPPLPTIPSEGLFYRNSTLMAGVVRENKVTFVGVQTGVDDGKRVQIRQGLKAGETVALNVPADLSDGATVQPVAQQQRASGRSRP